MKRLLDVISLNLFLLLVVMLPILVAFLTEPATTIGFFGRLIGAALVGGIVWALLCRVARIVLCSHSQS
jgi:hypothetical protein